MRCGCRSVGRASLCWQTQIITKSLSCWVLPTQRDRFSFPPLLPPLFFFFPQPHTIVHTLMAALKHWTGFSEQDRTPPPSALYVEYCTGLNCLAVAEHKMPPPPSFSQTGSWVTQGFSLPFQLCLSQLPSFIFLLSVSHAHDFPSSVTALIIEGSGQSWPVWSPTSRTAAVSYFGTPRPGWLAHFFECKTTLHSLLCFMRLPRPTSCWHWPRGLERDRGSSVWEEKGAEGDWKEIQPLESCWNNPRWKCAVME